MKKTWIFALAVGALAVTAGFVLAKHRNGKNKVEGECFPEYCGTCGDDEVMQRECGHGVDVPTLLHNRTRV